MRQESSHDVDGNVRLATPCTKQPKHLEITPAQCCQFSIEYTPSYLRAMVHCDGQGLRCTAGTSILPTVMSTISNHACYVQPLSPYPRFILLYKSLWRLFVPMDENKHQSQSFTSRLHLRCTHIMLSLVKEERTRGALNQSHFVRQSMIKSSLLSRIHCFQALLQPRSHRLVVLPNGGRHVPSLGLLPRISKQSVAERRRKQSILL